MILKKKKQWPPLRPSLVTPIAVFDDALLYHLCTFPSLSWFFTIVDLFPLNSFLIPHHRPPPSPSLTPSTTTLLTLPSSLASATLFLLRLSTFIRVFEFRIKWWVGLKTLTKLLSLAKESHGLGLTTD